MKRSVLTITFILISVVVKGTDADDDSDSDYDMDFETDFDGKDFIPLGNEKNNVEKDKRNVEKEENNVEKEKRNVAKEKNKVGKAGNNVEQEKKKYVYEYFPNLVLGKVHETFNFTIHVFEEKGEEESIAANLDIYWESNSSFIHPSSQNLSVDANGNATISLTSTLIGVYFINFYTGIDRINLLKSSTPLHGQGNILQHAIEVAVERQDQLINKLVNLGFAVALTVALFFLGMDIDLHIILKTVKRPIGPFLGMICQFGLMPGLAYVFGYFFLTTKYERLGLLLLGCSPGGAFSNAMTTLFGGDLNLSVTMTFFSTVASFAMTTFWVYLLGKPLVAGHIEIPYIRMGISLASFTLPALLGVWFKHKKPLAAEKVKAWVSRPFYIFVLVLTPFAVGATNWFFFYLCSWRHIVSGTLLAICGYVFGGTLAVIFCQKRAQVIAISMETAIQNVGIPLISLNLTFQSPYSDMGILPIISYFFFSTGPIMFLIYGCYTITSKICGIKHDEKKNSCLAVDQCNAGENLLLTSHVDGEKAVEELLATDAVNVDHRDVKLVPVQTNGTKEKLDKQTSTNNVEPEIVFIPVTPDTDEGEPHRPGPV